MGQAQLRMEGSFIARIVFNDSLGVTRGVILPVFWQPSLGNSYCIIAAPIEIPEPLVVNNGYSKYAPKYFSVPNWGGGRTWISVDEIEQKDFARLVKAGIRDDGQVTILTGAHGGPNGEFKPDRNLFQEDLKRWKNQTDNVKIIDISKINLQQIKIVINRPGRVICGFCWSNKNLEIMQALFMPFLPIP